MQREREAGVAVDRTLVEFVKADQADAFEHRIVEQHARQHAFGDDLDPRRCTDARITAHAPADGVANGVAEHGGHACGGSAGGEATGFQQQDPQPGEPRSVQQREGHCRRLACARRRHQDGGPARCQRIVQRGHGVHDGQFTEPGGGCGISVQGHSANFIGKRDCERRSCRSHRTVRRCRRSHNAPTTGGSHRIRG